MKSTKQLLHHRLKQHQTSALLCRMAAIFTALLLGGCSQMVLMNPKGPIGSSEKFVILASFALMLIVVIPVLIMVFWFSWKYRAGNTKEEYAPKWNFSARIEMVVWLVPAVIVTCLGILAWKTTYSLDPYKPIPSSVKPLTIEAVSMDWKWLFIYPDQDIAVVNQLVFPTNVPLNFKITSDTVMTSFFIPQLGSQIYAMAGMQTRLHLLADKPGTYTGQNQQLSGDGYTDMFFKAIATSSKGFDDWVQKARSSPEKLDLPRYRELTKPTADAPVTYFSSVKSDLFKYIISKYMKSAKMSSTTHAGKSASKSSITADLEEK
jgi:cytochrome o ubiquinol oxidase subunit 2